ncbi:MAG: polysulfide reductase [Acidimicrobiia bacterium]|nr:polysulfide reductase [Acidimicrobiia bacterium]
MTTDVTKDGLKNTRPGRDAMTGVAAGRQRANGSDSEAPPVGAEFQSYYGRPIVKPAVWSARDIAGYLFLGGLAGTSSVVAAAAEVTRRPAMARVSKTGAAVAAGLSITALVHDLGRPTRFVNMLRVFKPTSPMSVGSWLLGGYVPSALAAAASDLTGRARWIGRAGTVGAALLGPAVASYTAALIADTATPAWHDGYREMPFVFVSSGSSAAAGLALLGSPLAEASPARRLAVVASAAELTATKVMERRMGLVGENYAQGRAGRLMKTAEALTVAGTTAAVIGRRNRAVSAAAGAALVAASACTRFGIFYAGIQSAEDPRYTVVPQRARLEATNGVGPEP